MRVPADQPIRFTFRTYFDAAETVLADPTTASWEVRQPDGTETTFTWADAQVVRETEGVFHYDYTPTQTGHHDFHWKATGSVATALDGGFDVVAKYDRGIVSLDDVKTEINSTKTADDDELQGFIDAAVEVVENIVGPVVTKTVTEWHDGGSDVVILNGPVADLSTVTVTERSGATSQALAYEPSDGDAFTAYGWTAQDGTGASGVLLRTSTGYPARFTTGCRVMVTYPAGRSSVPPAIRLATLELVRHMWDSQRGGGQLRPVAGLDPEFAGETSAGYLIPNRVMELLTPYRLGPRIG